MLGLSSLAELHMLLTCFLLGVSALMPFNSLNSAPSFVPEYYKYASGDPNAKPERPKLWSNFVTFYNVVNAGTQIIFGQALLAKVVRRLPLTLRYTSSILLLMVEELVVILLPFGKVNQATAAAVLLSSGVVSGLGKAMLEATNFSLVGGMHPKYMSAAIFGGAFSGLITSVLQCIIKASMPDTYDSVLTQAHIYFGLTLGVLAIALLLALSLRCNSYVQQHLAAPPCTPESGEKHEQLNTEVDAKEPIGEENATTTRRSSATGELASTFTDFGNVSVWLVLRQIYPLLLSVFGVFFVTLTVYPTLFLPIDRVDKWFDTIGILLYNIGDAVGRVLTIFQLLWPPKIVLYCASASRVLFVPLFYLCIFGYIPGHAAPYIFMLILGLSNGFLGGLGMLYGSTFPTLTKGGRMVAGQMMGISLVAGLSVGSWVSLAFVPTLPS